MTAMTIERVRAFNGLDVLVARDEGLFAAEGLDLRIAPATADAPSTADGTLTQPVSVQGTLADRGEAAMFQGESAAITAGGGSAVGASGRASSMVCAAGGGSPDSMFSPSQELAHRMVALDYGNGTAYAGLLMLEGAMPRGDHHLRRHGQFERPARRGARGEVEATVLREPWITIAEKKGCRVVSTTFFHGTCRRSKRDRRTYAAFVRGVTRAARRINADKRRVRVPYFIADFPAIPMSRSSFQTISISVASSWKEPGPIPEAEARWAWEWMASWACSRSVRSAHRSTRHGARGARARRGRPPSLPGTS
jgi:hypothetical protein